MIFFRRAADFQTYGDNSSNTFKVGHIEDFGSRHFFRGACEF